MIVLAVVAQLTLLGAGPSAPSASQGPAANCLALEAGGCVSLEDASGTVDVEGV